MASNDYSLRSNKIHGSGEEGNKRIYKKICFTLAEFKLYKSRGFSGDRALGTELYEYIDSNFEFMSVPYPLGLYIDSIGCFINESMHYTPVPIKTENHIADACYSCMPHSFADVFNQLASGVEIEKVSVEARKCLQSLPNIDWMETKNRAGVETIQLTPGSVDFWLKPKPADAPERQQRELNVTTDDFKIFDDLHRPLRSKSPKIFGRCTNDDQGDASQMVRYKKYKGNVGQTHWYTIHRIPIDCLKLGIAFGFGHSEESAESSVLMNYCGNENIPTYRQPSFQRMWEAR